MTIKDIASIIASEINQKSKYVTATVNNDGKVVILTKSKGTQHGLDRSDITLESVVQDSSRFTGGEVATQLSLEGTQGDTYFQRWDSIKTEPRSSDDVNQVINGLSVMLETHINIDARDDIDRGVTKLTDIDLTNFGGINPVYSQQNNFRISYDTNEALNLDTYRNNITWTLEKHPGSEIDEWMHITLNSSLGLDGDKGRVSALRRFNNSIVSFQEKGIAEILFNSRTQIATSEGVPIEVANSGKVDGKRYISDKYGVMNKWSIVEGKSGIYFVDNLNKIIGLFNGNGIESISTKAELDAWVRSNNRTKEWNPSDDDNVVGYYDKIHSDVYFIKSDTFEQPCLVYSEILGGFVGFYDYSNVPMMTNVSDRFLSFRNGKLWLQNEGDYCNFFGEDKPFWVTWRVAPDMVTDKIWTNIEYRADFLKVLGNDYERTDRLYYDYMRKVDASQDFLYEIKYSKLDYDYAFEYFRTHNEDTPVVGCTSVSKGGKFAKSLDWIYSNQVDFITYSKDVVGVCGVVPELTKSVVEDDTRKDDELYRILPFRLLDGVNIKYGLYATVNVVPYNEEHGITTGTIPEKELKVEVCSSMLVRYILDNFRTATEAVEYIRDYMSVYMQQALIDKGFECHFMIADRNKSYILEFHNNTVVILENNIMTNFYLQNTTPNADGTYYTPLSVPAHIPTVENHIPYNSQGVERYNLCVKAYPNLNTKQDMRALLNNITYTNAYTLLDPEKIWYTEFVGINGLSVNTQTTSFATILEAARDAYSQRNRDDSESEYATWHTTHSCVYDLDTMTFDLRTQEEDTFEFDLLENTTVNESEFIDGDVLTRYTNRTFDELTVWNEYQTTGDYPIPSRPSLPSADIYPDTVRKFRIWRMDIPRAKKDVTSGNRFGLDRIRNPWVFVKLKKNSGNFEHDMMQLHDVIVKYFSNL